MQLLQGIRPAESGGDSYLVDARAAAAHLRSFDEEAYELFTRTRVRFHRKQTARLPFARMEAWYRAHDRFARLVRDPQNQLRFSLGPGDFVLYDNYRMLHARTAFRGARWLRGVYFDRRALAAEVGASAPL